MSGFTQSIADVKLILSTDKRIWAMSGFLAMCAVVFVVTQSWREPPPEPEEEYVRVRIDDDIGYRSLMTTVTKDFQSSVVERKALRDEVVRASNDFQNQQQEIDWHVDNLVERMNSVTEKLDKLVGKVGEEAIKKAQLEQRIRGSKSQVKRKIPVQGKDP